MEREATAANQHSDVSILVDMEAVFDSALLFYERWHLSGRLCPPFHPLQARKHHILDNFEAPKKRSLAEKMFSEDGFYRCVPAREGALQALHAMLTAGINVKLVISSPEAFKPDRISDILTWIGTKLGAHWLDRTIVCREKVTLCAEWLIDTDPSPNTNPKITPHWKHILLVQPYHEEELLTKLPLLRHWKSWKEMLQRAPADVTRKAAQKEDHRDKQDSSLSASVISDAMLQDKKWYRHGSEDSTDEDRLYLLSAIPEAKICVQLTSGVSCDRNFFTVSGGFVNDCFKGLPDEVHNGLLATYHLHKQEHKLFHESAGDSSVSAEFPLSASKMIRCVPLKVYAAVVSILLRIRKSQHRDAIRDVMRAQDLSAMIVLLHNVDFSALEPPATLEDAKYISFQLGQTAALIEGIDLYTKDKDQFEKNGKELLRTELNGFKELFLKRIDGVSIHKKGSLLLFYIDPSKRHPLNCFHLQSRGTIIDTERYRVVAFPLIHRVNADHRARLRDCNVLIDPQEMKADTEESITDRDLVIGYWYRGQQSFTLAYRFLERQRPKTQKIEEISVRENTTAVYAMDEESTKWRRLASRNMTSHYLTIVN